MPPPALLPPDDIKLTRIPVKMVYDFTKKSQNMKILESLNQDSSLASSRDFSYEERCDSRLKPEDL